jgi:hypothetical protein
MFFIREYQWEKDEQQWRMSFGGTNHRSYEYKDGGEEQKKKKNGDVF